MPGRTVDVLRSITRAPGGTATFAPTSTMRSPRISTTWLVSIVPVFASKSRPARIAVIGSWADALKSQPNARPNAKNPWNPWNRLDPLDIVAPDVDDEISCDCRADVFRIVNLVRPDDADV